jgi:endoglucanase
MQKPDCALLAVLTYPRGDDLLRAPVAARVSVRARIGNRWMRLVALAAALPLLLVVTALAPTGSARALSSWSPQCDEPPYIPTARDPGNPLMLAPSPPRSDPLRGADFFVPGPAHGEAAGAIARLVAFDPYPIGPLLPGFPENESWATFEASLRAKLPGLPASTRRDIQLLEKIAVEPDAQRISRSSAGGSPVAVYSQTQKLFCHLLLADPYSIPIITTYFLHATLGGCASTLQMYEYRSTFEAQINAMARAIGDRPAVLLLEIDAVGSSGCMASIGSLPAWEAMMRYEALTLEALPHTVVYLEGGYSDANTPRYAARMLNAAGVRRIQGFFTNDTHGNWTIRETGYAQAISKLTGGAHFVVNTATNGRGPLRNPHPAIEGTNNLCNPPGRGLGPRDTTNTYLVHADAFLWTHPPGNSSGPCRGGPPSDTFWPAYAIGLASRANGQLGPGYHSRPY